VGREALGCAVEPPAFRDLALDLLRTTPWASALAQPPFKEPGRGEHGDDDQTNNRPEPHSDDLPLRTGPLGRLAMA